MTRATPLNNEKAWGRLKTCPTLFLSAWEVGNGKWEKLRAIASCSSTQASMDSSIRD